LNDLSSSNMCVNDVISISTIPNTFWYHKYSVHQEYILWLLTVGFGPDDRISCGRLGRFGGQTRGDGFLIGKQ
jgi:hypothetical protein